MSDVRTRFAPSPTGYLHIGGARAALFNWLYSKSTNGKFILRIEDTDQARSSEESTRAIIDSMAWLGLHCDEGPFFQSKRLELYNEKIDKLLAEGKAYKCYCTAEELEQKRSESMRLNKKPRYDRKCQKNPPADSDAPYVVRFLSTDDGETIVKDIIKGDVIFFNDELDDLIIKRTDGYPTYNFVVVVDDADMGITHVIRGDDHLNNTPRQIQLYEAMGYAVPTFAHAPMILGEDKTRLSKRHGATSVEAYKDDGYLPQAMVNFLVRLGWSHGDQEIFTIDELIEKFDLNKIGKSAGVFNAEKLLWLNAHYIKTLPLDEVLKHLRPFLKAKGYEADDDKMKSIIELHKERAKTLKDIADSVDYYFNDITYNEDAKAKFLTDGIKNALTDLESKLKDVELSHDTIKASFDDVMKTHELKMKNIAQPIRVALTGNTVSPSIFSVIEVMGKEIVLKRLKAAIDSI
ncbi:glutamate--tRNA ligase [Thermodesulfobacteriota bacterium]